MRNATWVVGCFVLAAAGCVGSVDEPSPTVEAVTAGELVLIDEDLSAYAASVDLLGIARDGVLLAALEPGGLLESDEGVTFEAAHSATLDPDLVSAFQAGDVRLSLVNVADASRSLADLRTPQMSGPSLIAVATCGTATYPWLYDLSAGCCLDPYQRRRAQYVCRNTSNGPLYSLSKYYCSKHFSRCY